VGMNCLVFEYGNDSIMIDCGVMFPDEFPGVDVIHPAFDYVIENRHKLKAVILTHAHEDHIGAVPYLYQHVKAPLYASPFVLTLIEAKLKEFPAAEKMSMTPIHEDYSFCVGPISIEFAAVNHSIPQSLSVFMRTPAGNVLHTSDFKIGWPDDPDPFNRKRFERFRELGIDLLLSDSTNIEREGRCRNEAAVTQCLRDIIQNAPSRVFITLFPSNIRRVDAILKLSAELGKKVILIGRSVENYVKVAARIKLLSTEDSPIIPLSKMHQTENDKLLFIVAGSQGEERSTMTKIARRRHRRITIEDGDTFIFSSRHIPGNEMGISRVMDCIAAQGGTIFHIKNTPLVHVSGHAHSEELEEMIRITSPSRFIPIHGNSHYLAQHALLARKSGVKEILVIENGEVAGLSRENGLQREPVVTAGKIYVDGLIEVEREILDARKAIAEGGVVSAFVTIRPGGDKPLTSVTVSSYGVLDSERFATISHSVHERALQRLEELVRSGRTDHDVLKKELKKAIEKFFSKHFNRYPYVAVEVIELDE
ncbi:MAG: ribonuclease J, partial [Pseudomonadota bacterium]